MNTKKMLPLFVLVPVVVVLGVALGVLNHADTEEEDTSIALCSLDADSVTAIAYKDASDGATLESALTKTDDTWTLDSDPALPLDQSKAQGVADSMTALTALRELSDDADVASMGFDTPTYELSLKTADTEWTLTVGSKNSITNNWYARLSADGPVYTLDSSALSGICKTAKQLYAAQSITDIDVDDVTKMVVQTANGGTLSFAQNDSTWTLTDDAEYNLNQDIVKKMASTICDLKTKWSVTEPQADAVYGLDTPNAIVTLIASDGTSIQCSFGGNDAEDDTLCYLRSSGAAGCGAGQGGSGRVTGCTGFGEASAAPSRRSVSEPICSSTVREAAGRGPSCRAAAAARYSAADMVRKAEFPSFCGFSFICTRPEACSSAPSTP